MANQVFYEKRIAAKFLRFTLKEYKGTFIADLRFYYRGDEDELRPTKQGVQLNIAEWAEFFPYLQEYVNSFEVAEG